MNESQVFTNALKLATQAERAAYLDEACAGNPVLRGAVDALLRAHASDPNFLEQPAASLGGTVDVAPGSESPDELSAEPGALEKPGVVLAGRFKLLQQIGEGGMGTVWMAEQMQPVRRKVALKLIKSGMDSRQVLARFEAERQALALMDHPNIAKVLDAGTTGTGRPYFVMELVKGVPITGYCDEHRLTPRQRLELFVPVCQAVQHAHQKGIIHRDIKPSNVMVCQYDGRPVPKIIDFGIAKAAGPRLTEMTLFTELGQVVGTLEYMSPEQAELNQLDIDTRSDIYSLGVLLYELLTGSTPLERKRFQTVAFLEVLRLIREEESPRPSTRLSTSEGLPSIAANRGLEPKKLSGLMRGELDWIVMKTLEKDRSRRYETANELARDLERFLHDEAVEACPPSVGYKLSKLLRKQKKFLATAAAFLLLLLVGTVISTWQAVRATQALAAEAKRRQQTRQALDAMTSQIVEDWLAQQRAKDLTPQQRKFLEQALEAYEEFARDTRDDPASRAAIAAAYWRVGAIRAKLGQMADAEAALRRGGELSALLAADFPGVPDHRKLLASCHNCLGLLFTDMGQSKKAEVAYLEAEGVQKQLASDFPTVADYRQELARCQNNLGNVRRVTGQPREAEIAYRSAAVIFKQLAADSPTVAGYWHDLGGCQNNLSVLLDETGRYKDAEVACRDALAIKTKLTVEFPGVANFRFEQARVYNNLALTLSHLSRLKEAETAYGDALTIQKRLAADFPTVPGYRFELARSYSNLSALLLNTSRPKEAEAGFRDARALQKQLAADFPDVAGYRFELARSHNNLGGTLQIMDRPKEAEGPHRDAQALLKQLIIDFPNVPDFRNELAGTLGNLANLFSDRNEHAAARQLLEEALIQGRAALQANPRHPMYRQFFQNNLKALMQTLVDLGEHGAAAEKASQLLKTGGNPVDDAYAAASSLARCVSLAEKDKQLSGAKRIEFAQTYAVRAMTALRRAIENGYKDAGRLKKDTDLNALRGRDDFKKLLADLDAKIKGAAGRD